MSSAPSSAQPLSVLTLRHAEERDKQIWVTEDEHTVVKAINECQDRLVRFNRYRAGNVQPFSTTPSNIVNVEPTQP